MHQFSISIFKQLDLGHSLDNLYMLNGNFQDSLKSLLDPSFLDRLQLIFPKDFKKHQQN